MRLTLPAPTHRLLIGVAAERAGDAGLAVVLAVVAVVATIGSGADPSPGTTALIAVMFLALAGRSVWPVATALAVSLLAAGVWWTTEIDWHTAVAGWIAFYGLGRRVKRPSSVCWLLVLVTGLVGVSLLESAAPLTPRSALDLGGDTWFRALSRGSLVLAAFWFGDSQRLRDQLLRSFRERAERAEEHRRVVARQAVLDERNRIARELHDVVAHALSVMVVQATAALRLADTDHQGSTTAMANVAEVGRTAMGEMREVLGLLDSDRELSPHPRLADLDALIHRYRQSGLVVTVKRPDPLPRLPVATEMAVVRIVQEALTNALKHAPGSSVEVVIGIDETLGDEVEVEVVDRGPPGTVRPDLAPTVRSGRGLIGMRERVDTLGGTLATGPRPGGGFAVRARLPLDPVGGPLLGHGVV